VSKRRVTSKKSQTTININPDDVVVVVVQGEIEMRGFDWSLVEETIERMREYGSAEVISITVRKNEIP
jgi:hypothetical protein